MPEPDNALRDEIEPELNAACALIGTTNKPNDAQRRRHISNLQIAESRLSREIDERMGPYLAELDQAEAGALYKLQEVLNQNADYQRVLQRKRAAFQAFESLRWVNDGAFPWNISPVLYVIPLIVVGIAEWYVNFSTFEAIFIPVFAIAATLIVAAVFASASHLHGAYLKQLSEIVAPQVEYRNVLGRKIALVIATVLLFGAFLTVVWLRWLIISDQLGLSTGTAEGPFGGATTSIIWSRVGPTIIINLLIWGLGALYSWTLHEKVPELREKYRVYLQASKMADKKEKPVEAEKSRIKAQYERKRATNDVVISGYKALLGNVRGALARIEKGESA